MRKSHDISCQYLFHVDSPRDMSCKPKQNVCILWVTMVTSASNPLNDFDAETTNKRLCNKPNEEKEPMPLYSYGVRGNEAMHVFLYRTRSRRAPCRMSFLSYKLPPKKHQLLVSVNFSVATLCCWEILTVTVRKVSDFRDASRGKRRRGQSQQGLGHERHNHGPVMVSLSHVRVREAENGSNPYLLLSRLKEMSEKLNVM